MAPGGDGRDGPTLTLTVERPTLDRSPAPSCTQGSHPLETSVDEDGHGLLRPAPGQIRPDSTASRANSGRPRALGLGLVNRSG